MIYNYAYDLWYTYIYMMINWIYEIVINSSRYFVDIDTFVGYQINIHFCVAIKDSESISSDTFDILWYFCL